MPEHCTPPHFIPCLGIKIINLFLSLSFFLNHKGSAGMVIGNFSVKKRKNYSTAARKQKHRTAGKTSSIFAFRLVGKPKFPLERIFPPPTPLYSTTSILCLFLCCLFFFCLMLLSFYSLNISLFFFIHLTNTHCMPSTSVVLC